MGESGWDGKWGRGRMGGSRGIWGGFGGETFFFSLGERAEEGRQRLKKKNGEQPDEVKEEKKWSGERKRRRRETAQVILLLYPRFSIFLLFLFILSYFQPYLTSSWYLDVSGLFNELNLLLISWIAWSMFWFPCELYDNHACCHLFSLFLFLFLLLLLSMHLLSGGAKHAAFPGRGASWRRWCLGLALIWA